MVHGHLRDRGRRPVHRRRGRVPGEHDLRGGGAESGDEDQTWEIFQRAKIREEMTRLTELYGIRGYAFTDVSPSVAPDPQTKTAAITFHIKEGDLIRIRQIQITGNDKTRDNVIRRELRVNEQEVTDTVAMKR